MEKKTTRELLGEYIDYDITLQHDPLDEDAVKGKMGTLMQIKSKVDNIDYFMVDISRKEHLIDAEIEALNDEIHRLKVRRKATESLKKYFNQTLIPMIVEEVGTDGVYETDTSRYKLYETFGPVAITDETLVPDEYKKVTMVESIDKKKARTDLTKGVDISGMTISKVKRVRRS
tara:strand:+ start:1174 stop:1695 length:522 start_codon:yes stop_codon:yes gene_type:complete